MAKKTEAEKLETKIASTVETFRQYSTRSQYKRFLSEVQKLAVYLRADDLGNVNCVTCGQHYMVNDKNIQGGHYVSSTVRPVCYWLENIWPQCAGCNKWGNGMRREYKEYLGKLADVIESHVNDEIPFQTGGVHDPELMVRYLVTVIRPEIKRQEKRMHWLFKRHNHPPTC